MTWKDLLEILGVFVLSALKFGLVGVPAAVFAKWSFFKVLTVTISGGITGTVAFTFLSEAIIRLFKKVMRKFRHDTAKPKKKFTFSNKTLVRAKRRFGLLGIAILGPSVLSIPLGVFLSVRYFKNRKKIMSYFFVSIISWAVILYFFYNSIYKHF
jgi:hypothetical protein